MKTVFKIAIAALLVTPLVLMSGCGKRSRSGQMTKAPPNTQSSDFSSVSHNSKSDHILMSDYMYMYDVKGNKDGKKIYAQMSLFFMKSTDKTKQDQYEYYYREFVSCKDGPRSTRSPAPAMTWFFSRSDIAIAKKGSANFANLGSGVLGLNKNKHKAVNLTLLQNDRKPDMLQAVLNFKQSSETLEATYQTLKPIDPKNVQGIIDGLDCKNQGAEETSKIVPYGPAEQPAAAPQNGKNNNNTDSATLINQDGGLSNAISDDVQKDNQDG